MCDQLWLIVVHDKLQQLNN